MKKTVFICLLIALLVGIIPVISCRKIDPGGKTSCDGEDLRPKKFDIKSMATKAILLHSNSLADTTIHYGHDSITKTIYIDEIKISLNHDHAPSFSLIPQAIACSPADPTCDQKITSLYLISKSSQTINTNTSIAAGDTLNNLFEVATPWYTQNFSPFQNILNPADRYTPYTEFHFRLIPEPQNAIILDFDIKLTLSNGVLFTFENERLRVK